MHGAPVSPADPGVVVGAVHPAVGTDRAGDHGLDVRPPGYVGVDKDPVAPGSLDEAHRLLATLHVHVGHNCLRALPGEGQCRGPAYSRTPSGDEGHLALQSSRHAGTS